MSLIYLSIQWDPSQSLGIEKALFLNLLVRGKFGPRKISAQSPAFQSFFSLTRLEFQSRRPGLDSMTDGGGGTCMGARSLSLRDAQSLGVNGVGDQL